MKASAPRGFVLFLALSCVAVTAIACKGSDTLYPTTPSLPPTTTDTFSGTLTPQGQGVHSFNVSAAGFVTITLTAVGPDVTTALGLGIGTWDSVTSTCAPVAWNSVAVQGTVLAGSAVVGNFCTRVYDVGNIAAGATATYTVTVLHP